VTRQGRAAFLSYGRPPPRRLHGAQQLKYYIGSNSRGRTFLFAIEGFLYQSPINYYAGKHAWDMSPHYPRQPDCAPCHMPRIDSADIGHTMVTDHRIVRTARPDESPTTGSGRLIEFGRLPAART
jgi:hypothetical protein